VQGKDEVRRVAVATDAAMAVYRKAASAGCDMLFVHHGLIWGGLNAVTGRNFEHLKFLIEHGMSLYAAHLPLDAHEELGNNAELARMVGIDDLEPFGAYHGTTIGFSGRLKEPMGQEALAMVFQARIGGRPLILPFGTERIQAVAIISGGGSGTLPEAIDKGFDCFVTGEGSHQDHHLAKEAGINVIYLGHYHSETPGVRAVARDLENRFGLETQFIDEPTLL
jgi:dinuclear metal center YbgI/SA1388 family protein